MTGGLVWAAFGAATAAAVADWVAVWRRPAWDAAETALKPLVLALLVVAALALDPAHSAQRAWFVAALVLSLAGDVFLLPRVDRFVPGLASFLLAHLAYVAGFAVAGVTLRPGVVVLALLVPVAVRVVGTVARTEPGLLAPVCVYIVVIATMVGFAIGHGGALAIAGAVAFAASDSILALDRFDRRRRHGPLAVMVTYHLAQALLVLSLVR